MFSIYNGYNRAKHKLVILQLLNDYEDDDDREWPNIVDAAIEKSGLLKCVQSLSKCDRQLNA